MITFWLVCLGIVAVMYAWKKLVIETGPDYENGKKKPPKTPKRPWIYTGYDGSEQTLDELIKELKDEK